MGTSGVELVAWILNLYIDWTIQKNEENLLLKCKQASLMPVSKLWIEYIKFSLNILLLVSYSFTWQLWIPFRKSKCTNNGLTTWRNNNNSGTTTTAGLTTARKTTTESRDASQSGTFSFFTFYLMIDTTSGHHLSSPTSVHPSPGPWLGPTITSYHYLDDCSPLYIGGFTFIRTRQRTRMQWVF